MFHEIFLIIIHHANISLFSLRCLPEMNDKEAILYDIKSNNLNAIIKMCDNKYIHIPEMNNKYVKNYKA